MKWNSSHLEADAGDEQDDGNGQHSLVGRPGGQRIADLLQVGRPGQAVEQGHSVQQDARREGAEKKELHGRLVRARAAPEKSNQDINGNGHQFRIYGPCKAGKK